jgi:hypothetical protein
MANPVTSMEFLRRKAEELSKKGKEKGMRRVQGTHPVSGIKPRRVRDEVDTRARKKLRLVEEEDKEEEDKEEEAKVEKDKVEKVTRKKTLNLEEENTAREVEKELTNDSMVEEQSVQIETTSKEKCAEWVQKAAEAVFF